MWALRECVVSAASSSRAAARYCCPGPDGVGGLLCGGCADRGKMVRWPWESRIVSQNSERAVQRPLLGIVLFCVAQGVLTYGVLWTLVDYGVLHRSGLDGIALMVGVGDAQLALSGVLLGWRIFRWSVHWPLALVLLFSGSAIHYVSIVSFRYPFVSGEEYFIAPLQVVALAVALRLWAVRSGESAICLQASSARTDRLRLSDLFGWILAAALCLAIGKRALLWTDDGGMFRPWETFYLMIRHNPAMVLWRMPLLFSSIAAFVIAWILVSRAILTGRRLTFRQLLRALLVLGSLFVAELVFGFVPLLFDPPWPIVPVSIDLAFSFGAALFNFWSSDSAFVIVRGLELIGLFATQAFVFGGSLLLLRSSGVRLVPAIATSSKSSDGAS
jgi:hypothetical protein